MRAVLYLRVDAPERTESHCVAENQKEQLLELAREQGLKVWNIYKDIGFSGVTLDRPSLQALLRDAKEGRVDVVLVSNASRLARGGTQTAELMKQFRDCGVEIVTPYGAFDDAASLIDMPLPLLK